MKKLHNWLWVLLVLLFSYWSVHHLLLPGFFPMHDDTQVSRVFVMQEALSEGVFPVRVVSGLGYGYGYPIFTFYAPLAYYVGALLQFLVNDALLATKLMMAAGVLLSGVTMYFLAKEFWGRIPALVAALLYVYAPYHAINVYVRGAVAEFWAYVFFPLVFLGLWKTYKEAKFRYAVLTALSLAGVILSHNLSALMALPFVIVTAGLLTWLLLMRKEKTRILLLFAGILPGVLLSAFYWLPAIGEMGYTNVAGQIGGKADFRDHFVCLPQLWESSWGYGGSVQGCVDGLSFRLGKLHILFIVSGIILTALFFKKNIEKSAVLATTFVFFILAIFFSLPMSRPLWEIFSPLAYIQYPWRFLSLAVLFSSFIAGGVLWMLAEWQKKYRHIILPSLAVVSLLVTQMLYWKLFVPQTILQKSSADYVSPESLRFEISKISDEYLPEDFMKPLSPDDIPESFSVIQGSGSVTDIAEQSIRRSATVTAEENVSVLATITYFPGWVAYINGVEEEYEVTPEGLVIHLPEGEHEVAFVFRQTTVEIAGNMLSIAGAAALVVGILYARKKRFL